MTDRAEIERLLNMTGRTLEGLPENYEPEEAMKASKRGKERGWTQGEVILHQSDVIELLVGALRDALDKQPKWISVKELLPEDCKDVLVWAVYHEEYGRSWALREVDAYCKGVGWENTADPDVREVTHWMFMPEPPKEEANA